MKDKELKFMNFVYNDLLDGTLLRKLSPVQKPYVEFPWDDILLYPYSRVINLRQPPGGFFNYLYDIYGITKDEDICYIIWNKYIGEIKDRLRN
jgi:hypothetical protein